MGSVHRARGRYLGDSEAQLIRMLRANYDNIPAEVFTSLMTEAGHRPDEETVCKVCRMVAQEEYKRIGA